MFWLLFHRDLSSPRLVRLSLNFDQKPTALGWSVRPASVCYCTTLMYLADAVNVKLVALKARASSLSKRLPSS